MFSKACEYGIRAAIHIGQQSLLGERVSLKAVADAIDSPVAFTAKILQALAKEGIIISTKGSMGGYELPNNIHSEINLLTIVKAIDGDTIYKGCGLGLKECNEAKPCHLHFQFKKIRDELKLMLETTTVKELITDMPQEMCFLKR
jgi:Rrf2 family protein